MHSIETSRIAKLVWMLKCNVIRRSGIVPRILVEEIVSHNVTSTVDTPLMNFGSHGLTANMNTTRENLKYTKEITKALRPPGLAPGGLSLT